MVRPTSDGVAVVADSEWIGGRFRRRAVVETAADALPEELVTVGSLFEACPAPCRFLLDIADERAISDVLALAEAAGAVGRVWLAHADLDVLSTVRAQHESVRLVKTARLGELPDGPERLAAQLRERDIDAVEMPQLDWNAGMVALFHRFRRLTVGSGAQHERVLEALFAAGIDGVVGEHVDRMVDVAAQFGSLEST